MARVDIKTRVGRAKWSFTAAILRTAPALISQFCTGSGQDCIFQDLGLLHAKPVVAQDCRAVLRSWQSTGLRPITGRDYRNETVGTLHVGADKKSART